MTVFNELTMRSGAGDAGRGWNAGSRSRLVLTMSTTALLLVGANLATPLYPALQERLGLGPFAVTVAFSSYVLALIAGLVLYGHWSDHIGRRTALVLSVLVGLAGEIVFATAGGLAGLVTGHHRDGCALQDPTGYETGETPGGREDDLTGQSHEDRQHQGSAPPDVVRPVPV